MALVASGAPSLANEPIEVGPGIVPPRLLRRGPEARYPKSALAEHVAGVVAFRIRIDTEGGVRSTAVVSSPDERLSEAARATVISRRYAPATQDGRPVEVWWQAEVEFSPPLSVHQLDATCGDANAHDTGPVALSRENDVYPLRIKRVEPDLPYGVPRNGSVRLSCVINACGRVENCEATETSGPAYTQKAIECVTSWRYLPIYRNGKPTSCYYTFRISWDVQQRP